MHVDLALLDAAIVLTGTTIFDFSVSAEAKKLPNRMCNLEIQYHFGFQENSQAYKAIQAIAASVTCAS